MENYGDVPNKYKISSITDILVTLEDHLSYFISLFASPYIDIIKDDVKIWENKLKLILKIIDIWMIC